MWTSVDIASLSVIHMEEISQRNCQNIKLDIVFWYYAFQFKVNEWIEEQFWL